jgi:hypothetical protein
MARKVYIQAARRNISLVATDSARISGSRTDCVFDRGDEVEHIITALNGTFSNEICRSSA